VSTAPQAEYLTGKLIIAGDVDLDEGEIAPGVFIAIQREILRAVKVLPMYQQVAVVPVDDLAQLRAEIASVTAELQAAKDWILNDSKTIGELRSDLASLRVSYEQNAHQCVELNRDLARVTAQRDDCGTALSREIQKADSITYDLTALRASVARAEAATPAKHPDTARLDWLEKNRPILWALSQYASGDYWAVTDQPGYTEESWAEYRTARAAIDAAIGKARHD